MTPTVTTILYAALIIGAIGMIAAVILYFVSKAFKVIEDPRIDEVAEHLPGANCGGCGFAGCRALAEAIVKANTLDGYKCPAGGDMKAIAAVMGLEAAEAEPMVAVVRCNGSCENAPAKVKYDSALSCQFATSIYAGESACPFGCLGCGDCVKACKFDAIHIDETTGLPVVDEEKCVGCGACAKTCPRKVIEVRPKGKLGRRVFVSCVNKEKGAAARKNCSAACIGCGKCAKACPFEAIKVENNLAYIDFTKCKSCRKCAGECPTGAIHAVNFPPKKEAPAAPAEKPAAPVVEKTTVVVEKTTVVVEKTTPVEKPASAADSTPASEQ